MTMTVLKTIIVSALALFLAASTAAAQQPQPLRIRGEIQAVDGPMLTIKARDGNVMKIKLADNAHITAMVKASLADLKPGAFIGVTAMPQPDGSQKAIGINTFMDSQRGVIPSRHFPWDREPGSTMTNADIESTVAGVDGRILTVKYTDGEKKIIVPANTPIVRYVPGNASDLKPGAHLIIMAAKKMPDGSIETPAVNIGRDGVVPPM
jgi:hypothetical protein